MNIKIKGKVELRLFIQGKVLLNLNSYFQPTHMEKIIYITPIMDFIPGHYHVFS